MRRVWLASMMAAITWLGTADANAQSNSTEVDPYGIAIGIGFGIDKVNFDERTTSRGLTYFTGNVRMNFWSDDDDASSRARRRVKGYVEAEIGYWNDDAMSPFQTDLLLGVNAIGNVSAGTVDVFFGGGFGYHFFRTPAEGADTTDDGAVGANMQFGIDLNFSEEIAFFALGRYDILTGDLYDFQTKILGGLRIKF